MMGFINRKEEKISKKMLAYMKNITSVKKSFWFIFLSLLLFAPTVFSKGQGDLFEKYKNPNGGGFPTSHFDNWLLKVSFTSDNVPTYVFFEGDSWILKNKNSAEYTYEGVNSSAGSFTIGQIVYFFYKNKNPYFSVNDAYNSEPHVKKLQRFYFYKFYGKALGLLTMDMPLLAVDVYTKLVYAYAIPVKTLSLVGKQIPKQWAAFETYKNSSGLQYKFYEYDPIGWVNSDGTVVLYEWFKTNQRKADYTPKMNFKGKQVAMPNHPGKSPYCPF